MLTANDTFGMSNDERFKCKTLAKICETAQSVDINELLRVAEAMFPGGTKVVGRLPIRVHERPGWHRVMRADGSYEAPAYAMGGYRLDEIFIMADGTIDFS